ncbi:phosphoglycolate phosphatase [Aureimonas sp. Leaf454]|uniref:HAD hydrolase-like protein n=1 Tax=Aureimonas sp. Leaf454 TaxID=1736381 RepID=UPI0006FE0A92|nr:HAD hydrolase-like protein [Aureimonas sp. Leaf454]KQT53289.1 phosphoglycolate phosphatase [Aureimonas sp. Leaf454]
MIPLAVFDLDGTLVDTAPDLAASLNHCLASAGLAPVPLADIRPHAGHGARRMIQFAYGRAGHPLLDQDLETQLARFLSHYEANIAVASRPFPGILGAMDRLGAAGYRLAVCTNKREQLARLLLAELGLAERFAAICGSDTFAAMKPDPVHLLGTIDRAGGRPAGSFLVGDTATDTDAAIAACVPCILVDFGYAPDERARAGASRIIRHYDELDADLAQDVLVRA